VQSRLQALAPAPPPETGIRKPQKPDLSDWPEHSGPSRPLTMAEVQGLRGQGQVWLQWSHPGHGRTPNLTNYGITVETLHARALLNGEPIPLKLTALAQLQAQWPDDFLNDFTIVPASSDPWDVWS